MKVIIVGGTGRIGQPITEELSKRHEVIIASHTQGDIKVDITDISSVKKMYQTVGHFDALVATVGKVVFAELQEMTDEKFRVGLNDKLMGQVNLVIQGSNYINDNGSFTLTSGILNHDPIRTGCSAAMVNGALEGFVKSAAIELKRGLRINLVSPTVIAEAMPIYESYFRGYEPIPAARAALAYCKSVEGLQTGQVYRIGYCKSNP